MNKSKVLNKQSMRPILLIVCAAALAVAFVVALAQPAHADNKIVVPGVPDGVGVTADEGTVFLVGHAIGTQNYICLPSGTGFAYVLFTPEATLFDDNEQIITHFFSPNPDENLTIRATWQDSRDSSRVWAATVPNGASTDPKFVAKDAIAWLKLKAVGHRDGPSNGDRLSNVTFVQRLNTHGGVPPSTGCASLADVGNKAFVDYTADYFFYK